MSLSGSGKLISQIEFELDLILSGTMHSVEVETMIRTIAKTIINDYPDNRQRSLAIMSLLSATEHLSNSVRVR